MSSVEFVYSFTDTATEVLLSLDSAFSPSGIAGFLGAAVDPYLRERAAARFAGQGDDVVGAWLPLASSTEDIRASMGYGPPFTINKRTGELEDYIVNSPAQISMFAEGASLQMPGGDAQGELLTKLETAQMGKPSSQRQRATPPRPVLGMNEQDLFWTVTALSFYAEEAMVSGNRF